MRYQIVHGTNGCKETSKMTIPHFLANPLHKMNQRAVDITMASVLLLASFFNTGCKTAATTNPIAPDLTTGITVLTDVSTALTAITTSVTSLNSSGAFTAQQYATLSNDLTQAANYCNTALGLLQAGDATDAKTAVISLGNELITLNSDGDLGLKNTETKAIFDASVVAAEVILNNINL